MEPGNATRTGRSILAVTPIVTLALMLAGAAVDPPGSAGAPGGRPPRARAADACDGSATLAVSDRHPRQLRPVRFSAEGSTVPAGSVVFYDFSYGDGSDDASTQPAAVHAYQQAGNYLAKVSVVTSCNTIVSSVEYHVIVVDGLPPAVTVSYPKANKLTHFGRTGLLLQGAARDQSGIRRVELAIQLLSVRRSASAAAVAGCYWYDGRITLKVRACSQPLFFAARVRGSRWTFQMNPRSRIPPGIYTARVRATDRLGNMTTIFSPQLGNILAFILVA